VDELTIKKIASRQQQVEGERQSGYNGLSVTRP
jgi:hypothetical protein